MNFQIPNQSIALNYNLHKEAVLFLFTPRNIPQHYKRPLVYNFNNYTIENVNRMIKRGINPAELQKSNYVNEAVVPSTEGIRTNTQKFSDYWTFVLIVDNPEQNANLFINTSGFRIIHFGYCLDEPVSPVTMNLPNPTLNPNCRLRITRKIIVHKPKMINASGTISRESVKADVLVANYDKEVFEDQVIYENTPNLISDHIEFEQDYVPSIDKSNEEIIIAPLKSESLNVKDNTKISSSWQDPKFHFKTLVRNIEDASNEIVSDVSIGIYSEDIAYKDLDTLNSPIYLADKMLNHLKVANNVNNDTIIDMIGLTSKHPVYLSNVLQSYNPTINIIKTPKYTQADIIPQHHMSPEVVFTSIINVCVPSFLINVGLSSVSFMYTSGNGIYEENKFEVYHIESVIPSTQEQLQAKWRSFCKLFDLEIGDYIRSICGEFVVFVQSSISSSTFSKITLLDDPHNYPTDAVVEESNVLGGTVSNTIATPNHIAFNGKMLGTMISELSKSLVSGYDDEDDFMNNGFYNLNSDEQILL